jgi:hypothetical protein
MMDARLPEHLEVDHAHRPAYSRAELIALRLPERWYRAVLAVEQREADAYAQEHRSRPPAQR